MKEATLRDFFLGKVDAVVLGADVADAMVATGPRRRRHLIEDMAEGFAVNPGHLVRVCDAVLSGALEAPSLEPIGFCLTVSDTFSWDTDTPEGQRVAEVVHDWSAPEINWPLNVANVGRWREYLQGTGSSLGGPAIEQRDAEDKPWLSLKARR